MNVARNAELPESALRDAITGLVVAPVAVVIAWLMLTIPLWVCAVGVLLIAVMTTAYLAGFLRAAREVERG